MYPGVDILSCSRVKHGKQTYAHRSPRVPNRLARKKTLKLLFCSIIPLPLFLQLTPNFPPHCMAKITSSVFSLPTAFVASAPWSCPTNLCLSSYSSVSVWACITPRRSHLPSVLGHYTTWTASAALMHPFIHLKKNTSIKRFFSIKLGFR